MIRFSYTLKCWALGITYYLGFYFIVLQAILTLQNISIFWLSARYSSRLPNVQSMSSPILSRPTPLSLMAYYHHC